MSRSFDVGFKCQRRIDSVYYDATIVAVDEENNVTIQFADGGVEGPMVFDSSELLISNNNEDLCEQPQNSFVENVEIRCQEGAKRIDELIQRYEGYASKIVELRARMRSKCGTRCQDDGYLRPVYRDELYREFRKVRARHPNRRCKSIAVVNRDQMQHCGITLSVRDAVGKVLPPSWLPLAGNCAVCSKATVYRCHRCNSNINNIPPKFYCSRKCQKSDWATHKTFCQFAVFVSFFDMAMKSSKSTPSNDQFSVKPYANFTSRGTGTSTVDSKQGSSSHLLATPKSMIANKHENPNRSAFMSVLNGSASKEDIAALDGLPAKKHYPALPAAKGSGGINPSTLYRQGLVGLSDAANGTPSLNCQPCKRGTSTIGNDTSSSNSSSNLMDNLRGAVNSSTEETSKQHDEDNCSTKEFEANVANLRDNLGLNESEVRTALRAFNGDADRAAEWVLSNPGEAPPSSTSGAIRPPIGPVNYTDQHNGSESRRRHLDDEETSLEAADDVVRPVCAYCSKFDESIQKRVRPETNPYDSSQWQWKQDSEYMGLGTANEDAPTIYPLLSLALPLTVYNEFVEISGRNCAVCISQISASDFNTCILIRPSSQPTGDYCSSHKELLRCVNWQVASFTHILRVSATTVLSVLRCNSDFGRAAEISDDPRVLRSRGEALLSMLRPSIRFVLSTRRFECKYEFRSLTTLTLFAESEVSEQSSIAPVDEGMITPPRNIKVEPISHPAREPVPFPNIETSAKVLPTSDDIDTLDESHVLTIVEILNCSDHVARKALQDSYGDVERAIEKILNS